MDSFKVRSATKRDLPAIYAIEDDSFSDPYPHNLLTRLLREYSTSFLVAEADSGIIVGYCVASRENDSAHLLSVGVLPQYRRQGIGTALIEALIQCFASLVRKLMLEVKQGNRGAIRLYEDLGFSRVGLVENYYTDGSSAVKMQLTIHDETEES